MTNDELKLFVTALKVQGLSRGVLKVTKPPRWRPKGFKLRTVLGLVEIMNLTDQEDHTSVVVMVEIAQIERYLRRVGT